MYIVYPFFFQKYLYWLTVNVTKKRTKKKKKLILYSYINMACIKKRQESTVDGSVGFVCGWVNVLCLSEVISSSSIRCRCH